MNFACLARGRAGFLQSKKIVLYVRSIARRAVRPKFLGRTASNGDDDGQAMQ